MSAADADSKDAVLDVQEHAFGYRSSEERRRFDKEAMDPSRVVVSRDGADVVGAAEWLPSTMSLPGGVVEPVAAVTGVAVRPTHRRQGRLRAMMRHQLDDLRSRGLHSAVLIATESRIYQRFGYGPATLASRYSVDKRGLSVERGDWPGRVSLVSAEEARRTFPAVLEAAQPARAGEVGRLPFEWEHTLGRSDKKENSRYFVSCDMDGAVTGYAIYQIAEGPTGRWQERSIRLDELCTLTGEAYRALWSYLISIDLIGQLTTGHRPVDEPIRWALSDYRAMTTTRSAEFTYVRLLEAEAALARRRYERAGAVRLEVRDSFCPWNEGTYEIEADGTGGASVSRVRAEGQLALDTSVLASLYLGALRASSLAAAGILQERSPGALEAADTLFAVGRPPYCTTSF